MITHTCAPAHPIVRPFTRAEKELRTQTLPGHQIHDAQQLRNMRAGAPEVPVLTKGTVVLIGTPLRRYLWGTHKGRISPLLDVQSYGG